MTLTEALAEARDGVWPKGTSAALIDVAAAAERCWWMMPEGQPETTEVCAALARLAETLEVKK